MNRQALFVDLPNLYTGMIKSSRFNPDMTRDYFMNWFDFDRLAEKLTGSLSSVWIFHSMRKLGPSNARIQDRFLESLIKRINSQIGVTAYNVDIPGTQREPTSYECSNCGHQGYANWESEKGIDASLIVRLFDTMDTWDIAYLLSGDADFVPAVSSLRRRGKQVSVASFAQPSEALQRECYETINLWDRFVTDDLVGYEIFRPDGVASRWLTAPVPIGEGNPPMKVKVYVAVTEPTFPLNKSIKNNNLNQDTPSLGAHVRLMFTTKNMIDITNRQEIINQFSTNFPNNYHEDHSTENRYFIQLAPLAWSGIERQLYNFKKEVKKLDSIVEGSEKHRRWVLEYNYNETLKAYRPYDRN